jgi:hypothetical protein
MTTGVMDIRMVRVSCQEIRNRKTKDRIIKTTELMNIWTLDESPY